MTTSLTSADVQGGYTPTPEQKAKLRINFEEFALSGDGVFHTIQGEGNRAGRPTTFVRLHFCNLSCEWCDARYTRRRDTEEFYQEPRFIPIDGLTPIIQEAQREKEVQGTIYDVTFTGGEPLMHQRQIVRWIKDNPQYSIQIETNGTLPIMPELAAIARFNCSPKLQMSGNDMSTRLQVNVLKQIAETQDPCFKFVFRTIDDINETLNLYDFLPRNLIWFMPEGVTKEQNAVVLENTIDYILSTGCNVALRGQNVMWDGAKRGV